MSEGMRLGPVPAEGFLVECVCDDDPTRTPKALEAIARKVFEKVPATNGEAALVRYDTFAIDCF